MSPRNPKFNKHNQPSWWNKRLKKAGCAVNRGKKPQKESHVGTSNALVGIEEQNAANAIHGKGARLEQCLRMPGEKKVEKPEGPTFARNNFQTPVKPA